VGPMAQGPNDIFPANKSFSWTRIFYIMTA